MGGGVTTIRRDHLDGPFGQIEAPIDDEHARAGAGEEDGGGTAVADAVSGGATSGDNRHLPRQSGVIDALPVLGHGPASCRG